MTLTTQGIYNTRHVTEPVYDVPGHGGATDGTNLTPGVPWAMLLATNRSVMAYGGVLAVQINTPPYGNTTPGPLSNVHIDHIIVNGNYANRFAANPVAVADPIHQNLNVFFNNCTNCSFNYGASLFSVSGGLLAQFVNGFQADHNSFAYEGNLFETPIPRHAQCLEVGGTARYAQITNNYMLQCTDNGISLDPDFYGDMTGVNIQNNFLFARGRQYMSAGIVLNTVRNGILKGVKVQNNVISCSDPANYSDAQCSIGIEIGSGMFVAAGGTLDTLNTGVGADGLQVLNNYINGPSIGIIAEFDPKPNNMAYVSGNAISVTKDNPATGFFLPMSCKQYHGTKPNDPCCQTAPGQNWYQRGVGFPAPFKNISFGGNPIVSAAIVMNPYDFPYVVKDLANTQFSFSEAYPAWWYGSEQGVSCY